MACERLGLDPRKLVFVDETWAKTNMRGCGGGRRRRAAGGEGAARALADDDADRGVGPPGRAVLDDGGRGGEPGRVRGARRTGALPSLTAGDVVILDNLSSHKGPGASAGRGARTLLFLPPYSPDLNLIELAFAKLKQLLRSAGTAR